MQTRFAQLTALHAQAANTSRRRVQPQQTSPAVVARLVGVLNTRLSVAVFVTVNVLRAPLQIMGLNTCMRLAGLQLMLMFDLAMFAEKARSPQLYALVQTKLFVMHAQLAQMASSRLLNAPRLPTPLAPIVQLIARRAESTASVLFATQTSSSISIILAQQTATTVRPGRLAHQASMAMATGIVIGATEPRNSAPGQQQRT